MKLVQLLYISTPVVPLKRDELALLLTQSRKNNANMLITGLLLYNQNSFMQVIEGPSFNLHRVFNKIEIDKRHRNVREIYCKPIAERQFSNWRMGFRYLRENNDSTSLFESTVSRFAESIDQNLGIPKMREFMRDYYDPPIHDIFEGWVQPEWELTSPSKIKPNA